MEHKPPATLALVALQVLFFLRPDGFGWVPSPRRGCLLPWDIIGKGQWARLLCECLRAVCLGRGWAFVLDAQLAAGGVLRACRVDAPLGARACLPPHRPPRAAPPAQGAPGCTWTRCTCTTTCRACCGRWGGGKRGAGRLRSVSPRPPSCSRTWLPNHKCVPSLPRCLRPPPAPAGRAAGADAGLAALPAPGG